MNTQELALILDEHGVREGAVSLNGRADSEEQYRLEKVVDSWQVYYCERGNKNDVREFSDESEACEFLLEIIKEDPTAAPPSDRSLPAGAIRADS